MRNSDPEAPWNSGPEKYNPFAPWNAEETKDDPLAPWNNEEGKDWSGGRYNNLKTCITMRVKLKKVSEEAMLPKQSKEGDFCYDVWAVDEEEISPNVWKYKLGFKYELVRNDLTPENYSISIDLRPRSGIYKTGMVLANSEGTLDEFYRGEAMAIFYHVIPSLPRYKKGDRVAQIKLGISIPLQFEFVDEINENTERGEGGFGHTGRK